MLLIPALSEAQQLIVYTNILGRSPSDQYTCRVRQAATGNWTNAFVIQTKSRPWSDYSGFNYSNGTTPIDSGPTSVFTMNNGDTGYFDRMRLWSASYVAFEFTNMTVEVEISKTAGTISNAVVRPAGAATVVVAGGKATVTMNGYVNINVDINGQMEGQYTGDNFNNSRTQQIHTIGIFANPIYPQPTGAVCYKAPGDPMSKFTNGRAATNTLVFLPGVHTNLGTQFVPKDNETYYIPGNAIVHGTFKLPAASDNPSTVNNLKVYGSGALSGEMLIFKTSSEVQNKLFTGNATAALLRGFVVLDPANHTFNFGNGDKTNPSNRNIYNNLKIFGWRKNGDAVNAFENSQVMDCFFRVQDDVFYLGTSVQISNNVAWNDMNGSVLFLSKSDANSYFKDIKVIYQRMDTHTQKWGKTISMRDTTADIRDVRIQNVLVEDPFPAFAPFLADTVASGIQFSNIVFENVRQDAHCVANEGIYTNNFLSGFSSSAKIANMTFSNCFYNGKFMTNFASGDFKTNQFVDGSTIKFVVTGQGTTYTLTESSPNGSVSFNPAAIATNGTVYTFNAGTAVTVTAFPANGYTFTGWGGDLSGSANPTNIMMNANKNITANTTSNATGEAVPWMVNFNGLANGTTGQGAPTTWATTRPVGVFQVSTNRLMINNGVTGGGITNEGVFTSGIINISGQPVDLSMTVQGIGTDASDYVKLFIKTNGGAETLLRQLTGVTATTNWIITGITGTNLQVVIRTSVSFNDEYYYLDDLSVTSSGSLPSPWQTMDVGAVGATGSASYNSGTSTWTIAGAGADIWGTADAFRYVYQSADSNCSVVAKVLTIGNTDPWAKAGVMIRETTNTAPQSAMMCVTPSNGVAFQWRSATGGTTTITNLTGQSVPIWLRITRTVNSIAGSYSSNGTNWTQLGAAQTIVMQTNVTIGLGVTSRTNGLLNTSTMDNVTATP